MMRYRIFLYRAVTLPGFAPPTGLINAAVRAGERDVWQGAAPLLEGFDAPAVRCRIQDALADPAVETGKGYPLVKFPPQPFAQTPYIYVATSSARAIEVLPCLYTIALENDLVMYDAETDRVFYSGSALGADDVVDRDYITMLNRHLALCCAIREETPLLFSLHWPGPDDLYDVVISDNEGGKFRLIDRDGHVLLPCVYHLPVRDAWRKHLPVTFTENGRKGLMDLSGHIILPAAYEDITDLDEPLIEARNGSREQPVTSLHLPTGETVFQSPFDHVSWCRDGRHFYCCRPGLCEMYEYEPLA